MLIVYALSTASMLWSLYRNNWEWRENKICCQTFQIQANQITKVLDIPLTIFIAATAGAAGGYVIKFAISIMYPVMLTTILGMAIIQSVYLIALIKSVRQVVKNNSVPAYEPLHRRHAAASNCGIPNHVSGLLPTSDEPTPAPEAVVSTNDITPDNSS